MEDAARALLMAGNVLIFLIALTVCISSFSSLRAGIDNIMEQTETVQMAQDSGEYLNFFQSKENGAVRVVGPETVISSMYRSVKEDYVIYIKLDGFTGFTEQDFIQYNHKAEKDLKINNNTLIEANTLLIKVTLTPTTRVGELVREKIYSKIKDSTFLEYLGEYQTGDENVSQENKQTYRVITYIEKTTE